MCTFLALSKIHKYLFDDIYNFAGEVRIVNIAKGNLRFVPLMYLEVSLKNIDKNDYLLAMDRSPIKDLAE